MYSHNVFIRCGCTYIRCTYLYVVAVYVQPQRINMYVQPQRINMPQRINTVCTATTYKYGTYLYVVAVHTLVDSRIYTLWL